MPSTSFTVTALGNRQAKLDSIELPSSLITAVTVIDQWFALSPVDTWIEIGLLSDGDTYNHKSAVFCSGYIGRDTSPFWTGKQPVGSSDRLYGRVLSATGGTFLIRAHLNKPVETEKGGIILDP